MILGYTAFNVLAYLAVLFTLVAHVSLMMNERTSHETSKASVPLSSQSQILTISFPLEISPLVVVILARLTIRCVRSNSGT